MIIVRSIFLSIKFSKFLVIYSMQLFKNKTLSRAVTSIFFLCLYGCFEQKDKLVTAEQFFTDFSCINTNNNCEIEIKNLSFTVLFNVEKIRPEQEFIIAINKKNELPINKVSGYIEGRNMYMGKIPVVFEETSTQFIAKVTVGACSEPNMQWRLWLNFDAKQAYGSIEKKVFIDLY